MVVLRLYPAMTGGTAMGLADQPVLSGVIFQAMDFTANSMNIMNNIFVASGSFTLIESHIE